MDDDVKTVKIRKSTHEKIERLLPAARLVTGMNVKKVDLMGLAVDKYGEWLGRKVKKQDTSQSIEVEGQEL